MVLYELLKFDTFRQDLFENPFLCILVCVQMLACAHAKRNDLGYKNILRMLFITTLN